MQGGIQQTCGLASYQIWQRESFFFSDYVFFSHVDVWSNSVYTREIFLHIWTAWNIFFYIAILIPLVRRLYHWGKSYGVLEDLCSPQKPTDISYEGIKHLLLEHFRPKHLVIAKSYGFYETRQEDSESISNDFVRLKHLAFTCEFGTFLERTIRDKFACGPRKENILIVR